MFESTTATARVYPDETGAFYEIPVLLTADGPLRLLVDYFVEQWDSRSPKWMVRVVASVRLFLDYAAAHPDCADWSELFQSFRQRLLTGSVNRETGEDPSGLYWTPRGPRNTATIIRNLTDLFNWWAKKNPSKTNPADHWKGSAHDLRVAESAYQYRRHSAFLGHTWSSFQETSRRPGTMTSTGKWPRAPSTEHKLPPAFPEDRILDLVLKGFKVGKRYNYRDMLITLLLNGAGFRVSEPFHLYLWDVSEDPAEDGKALVLIHHPSWGLAPPDPLWTRTAAQRAQTAYRSEYLATRYGMAPRDWGLGTDAAGWKGGMHETQFGGYYKQAYWFVPEFGRLFWNIWHLYIEQVQRIDLNARDHPFAFMNTTRAPVGAVYKMGKFEASHAAAVRRIGLVPAKHLGTSIHGHRHAYGQRLRRAGIGEEEIRRFMHHTDLESQRVYTEADRAECLEHLAKAVARLNVMAAEERRRIIGFDPDAASKALMVEREQKGD